MWPAAYSLQNYDSQTVAGILEHVRVQNGKTAVVCLTSSSAHHLPFEFSYMFSVLVYLE